MLVRNGPENGGGVAFSLEDPGRGFTLRLVFVAWSNTRSGFADHRSTVMNDEQSAVVPFAALELL